MKSGETKAKRERQTRARDARALDKRYARTRARLGKLGLLLQGTITEREIVREDPERRPKMKTYGPYYQWTWKRSGKTVTVNLSAAQAKTYQKAIDEHRKLEQLAEELRTLSLQILEQTTRGVTKRKARK